MSRFRVGEYSSLVMGYVISKDAKEDAKMLERNGHIVDWYL